VNFRLPPHSSCSDSGVPACPQRPTHWGKTRLKFLAALNSPKSEVAGLSEDTPVTFLPMEAIGQNGELDVSRTRPMAQLRNGYTYLREGDVCIAKITPCFENGKGAIVRGTRNGIAFGTTELLAFRCYEASDAGFLYFVLTSPPFKVDAEASMYGAGGQQRVGDSFAANYEIVLPPLAERSQIARFLDFETARIDALIDKQEQLIALLKEKRQAVISHAVTKGLNPDAPLRDSGVEWLGMVPAHWEVTKLHHLSSRIGDGLHGTPNYQDGTGLYFINGNNLEAGRIIIGVSAKEVPRRDFSVHQAPLSLQTVLLSINGTIGKVALYGGEQIILGKSAAYINCSPALRPSFLMAFFESDHAQRYYELLSTGTTISNLSLNAIRQLKIGLPSLEEQAAIVQHVMKQREQYDALISTASNLTSTLQERRTALISAAVTGKIDVRDWKPPESKVEQDVA
jgi:type I restriction enzyme S subunit